MLVVRVCARVSARWRFVQFVRWQDWLARPKENCEIYMKNCASSEVATCQNCSAAMSPTHQCELPPQMDPLPLCHYCCHRGSGDHPVHYYQQCLCNDSPCTCLCYYAGAQLEHKHRVFPSRFWGKTCDPVNVPKAKAFADERTERLRGYSPNCTYESCVRYMKEDGLCLS